MPGAVNKGGPTTSLTNNIKPSMAMLGVAAAAGAFIAGKWIYDNSEKITVFLDDWASDASDNLLELNTKVRSGVYETSNVEDSPVKRPRNVPIH